MIDGVGGGICQVSSTIYLSALYADLEITERKNHRFTVTYIPLGQDATVMYGSIDFRFKNNRNSPICLYAEVKGNKMYVKIAGKKEAADEGKVVEIHSNAYNKKPYETITKTDESLAPGKTKLETHGTNGYTVETYKKITVNGEVVSDEFLHKSVYVPCNEVILAGPETEPADSQVILPSDPQPEQTPTDEEEPNESEPSDPQQGEASPAIPGNTDTDISTVPGFI
ncbi:hypothetical protein SDC9_102183 [bioreactor metagenome]|uniref:G5 domain-containing protein n=1 Tax=bioreactor metagenome TaxID=1076179 RepID=A0A645AQQ8_9ZZZZ